MSRSSSSASSTRSFGSETNAQDLKPIKGYLSNRRELARQLFKSVKPDKIRMMLPQILKNANLKELEERCAGELCGMSEARILCILKGRTMSGSSDTSETDDSGPSLEIISDTEEWLTDTEVTIKQEPSSSGVSKAKRPKAKMDKRKSRAQKRKDRENSGVKSASKGSVACFDSNLKPKKEKHEGESRPVASATDNKEGESLLDLLELEMRARAIRALIRKEEDTPQVSDAKEKRIGAVVAVAATSKPVKSSVESVVSASVASNETPHGKEASSQSNEVKEPKEGNSGSGEDEDVVFVVAKPTPTIELVSSDDETTGCDKDSRKGVSNIEDPKRSAIQRACKRETVTLAAAEVAASRDVSSNGRTVTIDKSTDGSNSLKIIVTKRLSDSSNGHTSGKTIKTRKIADNELDKSGAKEKNSPKSLESNDPQFSAKGLFKKVRRKDNLRSKRKTIQDSKRNKTDESAEKASVEVDEAIVAAPVVAPDEKNNDRSSSNVAVESAVKLEIPERHEDVASCANESTAPTATRVEGSNKGEREEESRAPITDDDRLDDFEEIIDLDDYPDDMDEIENKDEVKKIKGEIVTQVRTERKTPQIMADTIIPSREANESAETWASRYYQTDDVQNVIKESKIQSEIRKRLRERQRLSKSNNSPKLQHGSPGESGNATLDKAEEKILAKATTGSVGEYLALKNSTSDNRCADEDIEAAEATSKSPRSSLETPSDEKDSTSSPDESKTSSDETKSAKPPLQPAILIETAATVR